MKLTALLFSAALADAALCGAAHAQTCTPAAAPSGSVTVAGDTFSFSSAAGGGNYYILKNGGNFGGGDAASLEVLAPETLYVTQANGSIYQANGAGSFAGWTGVTSIPSCSGGSPPPLAVQVSPTSDSPSICPVSGNPVVATASAVAGTGDGNPITWSLAAGGDPNLTINSSGQLVLGGSTAVCGHSYSTTVNGVQP